MVVLPTKPGFLSTIYYHDFYLTGRSNVLGTFEYCNVLNKNSLPRSKYFENLNTWSPSSWYCLER